MKGIVLHAGKYGSTEEYARWIAEDLGLPCGAAAGAKRSDVADKDLVVLGTAVHAGKLLGAKWLAANEAVLRGKRLVLFTVSGADFRKEPAALEALLDANVPASLRSSLQCHPLQGRQVMAKYPWLLRTMLKMYARSRKDPEEAKGAAADWDFVRRENVAPIVAAARG